MVASQRMMSFAKSYILCLYLNYNTTNSTAFWQLFSIRQIWTVKGHYFFGAFELHCRFKLERIYAIGQILFFLRSIILLKLKLFPLKNKIKRGKVCCAIVLVYLFMRFTNNCRKKIEHKTEFVRKTIVCLQCLSNERERDYLGPIGIHQGNGELNIFLYNIISTKKTKWKEENRYCLYNLDALVQVFAAMIVYERANLLSAKIYYYNRKCFFI